MAEAVRRRAVVVASGAFGHEVAAHVTALLSECDYAVATASEPLCVALEGAHLVVRAAWREVQAEFEAFAIAATAVHAPWLQVAYAHPYVRVGPAFAAGGSPCPECYLRRRRQHGHDPVDDEVARALAGIASLGVRGHPPCASLVAAGQAVALLGVGPAGAPAPRFGHVALIDCETDELSCVRVHAAPGCGTCDPDSALQARRTANRDLLRRLAPDGPGGR